MIHRLIDDSYTIPEHLRDMLIRDPTGDQWAHFTAAHAFARAGFAVLPCTPGGKTPLIWGAFRHGARTASDDSELVRDAFLEHPGANVGIAPDHHFVVLDIDPRNGGSLEAAAALGLPVDGYRERSGSGGWHLPLVMPHGHHAERSTVLGPGLELKAHGTYVISPHSRLDGGGWYRPEVGRDVWWWGAIPKHWPHLDRLTEREAIAYTLESITDAHRREARRVSAMLMQAPARISHDAQALLAGIVPPDASPSEADYRLALLASMHTTSPEVVAAVLEASSLARPKWRKQPTYLGLTISKAMRRRVEIAETAQSNGHTSISDVVSLIATGRALSAVFTATPETPTCELMGHLRFGWPKSRVVSAVMAFLVAVRDAGIDSAFWRDEGWLRVPVCDLAETLNCDHKTIARALTTLVTVGLIERRTVVTRVAGSPRADSLARLTVDLEGTHSLDNRA